MKAVKVDEVRPWTPPLHFDVDVSEFVGAAQGAARFTWALARMKPGGGAESHTHPDSEHAFFVIQGEMVVSNGRQEYRLRPGTAIFIPPGEPHSTRNAAPGETVYLTVTSPPLPRR
ncbi:MAG: cupin domain-containing protein [Acetobacteraceae bacterium]|nr:cupin domain-containing protein [Acetobacteraceae bacterium]